MNKFWRMKLKLVAGAKTMCSRLANPQEEGMVFVTGDEVDAVLGVYEPGSAAHDMIQRLWSELRYFRGE